MKLDQEIFKNVFGRDFDKKEEKDIQALTALHYFLAGAGLKRMHFRRGSRNSYGYRPTEKGLVSDECRLDILSHQGEDRFFIPKLNFALIDDLKLQEKIVSQRVNEYLSSVEIALESTREILSKDFDDRDAIIYAGMYDFLNYYYLGNKTDDEKSKRFYSEMPNGDYELGRTLTEQIGIVYGSIIESNRQSKSNPISGENEG